MTESKRIKINVKLSSIVAIALLVAVVLHAIRAALGMTSNLWDFARDFALFTGTLFLFQKISPIYLCEEGLECNLLHLKPIAVPWREVDFDRIMRNKFTPFVKVPFVWFLHHTILFPGYFHIVNREEVLSFIDRHTRKYRE